VSLLPPDEAARIVRDAVEAGALGRALAERLATSLGDPQVLGVVCEGAAESKRLAVGDRVTVSRNVFIPLTNLCRDRCAYCTFAKLPDSPEAKTYSLEEVEKVVRGGAKAGCSEALFCLGDKPEVAYRSYRAWLAQAGYGSTAEYLVESCKRAVTGGLLPHTNAGILGREQLAALRPWNASMGLMLESTSPRLRGRGMAHHYCPDKDPEIRLRMHAEAGQLRIPFTSGLLLGIGENDAERVDTLLAIRGLDDRYGHIQEAIIQPFHPKPGTPMRAVAPLDEDAVMGWVALARLVLGRAIEVQAPPNLAPGLLERLLRAGVSDWGGVSPVTVDFINPEAPWPGLRELRLRTEAAGQRLVERLPVHARYVHQPEWFHAALYESVLARADEQGYARVGLDQEAA